MAIPSRSEVLKSKPIGDGLNGFRDSHNSTYEDLDSEELNNTFFDLILALHGLPASRQLPSSCGGKNLLYDDLRDLLKLIVNAGDFDIKQLTPLLQAALSKKSDYVIWEKVYAVVTESTCPRTPPRPYSSFPSYVKYAPNRFSSGRLQNTSERVEQVRGVLKYELNANLELDHPEFVVTYLAVPQVEDVASAVFKKCHEGEDPLYTTGDGCRGWGECHEKGVQRSLEECFSKFMKFLDEAGIESPSQRRFVPSPDIPIPGPLKREPNLCVTTFTRESTGVSNKQTASWRQICDSPCVDPPCDFGNLIGWAPRLQWHLISIKNGLLFVKTLLSFLWMNDEQLGLDSNLMEVNNKRFVKINRDGKEERLIITEATVRSCSVHSRPSDDLLEGIHTKREMT